MEISKHLHYAQYRAWFSYADTDSDGKITGADSKALFPRSRLPQKTLAAVWQLCDDKRQGALEMADFVKAMELISLAQAGEAVTDEQWLISSPVRKPSGVQAGIEPPRMDALDGDSGFEAGAADNPFGSAELPKPPGVGAQLKKKLTLKRNNISDVSSLVEGLKAIYLGRLKSIEEQYHFPRFYMPTLGPADFAAKPAVLILGQYSTGKTTFIKSLLGRLYPGSNIGPEPTTDRFTVVMHGYEDRQIPGNTLTVSPDLPFQSLHHFGTGFLSRLEGAQCNVPLLQAITLVDTPGVLSGEKQRIERAYNFVQVCQWFASRADLILLLFDPHKLDISDELKEVIAAMKGNEEKMRVCLNKADSIDQQQLLRVYGALMWSLGKVVKNPEVVRVFVGSFNGGEAIREDVNPNCRDLFHKEYDDLMEELHSMPQRSCDRKVNELVKRVRALRVHLLLLQHLKSKMPALLFKQSKAAKILEDMPDHFLTVQQQNHLAVADFPKPQAFADILGQFGLEKVPKVADKHIKAVEDALSSDIPRLIKQFTSPY